jgi:hypothetical protein
VNDCQNATIRDQLPDLLHDRLSAADRAVVLAHLDGCGVCRDELELLGRVRGALLGATPRVNTLRILSALPKPGTAGVLPIAARASRSRWSDWRIAAAVTVLVAGGGSVVVLSHSLSRSHQADVSTTVATTPLANPASPSNAVLAPSPATSATPVESAVRAETTVAVSEVASAGEDEEPEAVVDGRLRDLSEQQLQALLNEIGQMRAVPITEPTPITIKVDSRAPGSGDTEIR